MMNNDYKQIYKNTGLLPRTYDQAYKTADYATAFWKCETDNRRAIKLLFTWVVAIAMLGFIFSSFYGLFVLLGNPHA